MAAPVIDEDERVEAAMRDSPLPTREELDYLTQIIDFISRFRAAKNNEDFAEADAILASMEQFQEANSRVGRIVNERERILNNFVRELPHNNLSVMERQNQRSSVIKNALLNYFNRHLPPPAVHAGKRRRNKSKKSKRKSRKTRRKH
jgi:hypothetical protein